MFTSIQIHFAWNIPASKSVKAAASKKKLNSSPPLRPLHWAMCSSLEYNQSGYRIHHACCLSCLAVSPANIFSCTKKPSLLKVQPKHPAKLFSSQRFFFWISVSYGCCVFSLNTWRSEQIFGASDSKRRRCKEHQRVPQLCINMFFMASMYCLLKSCQAWLGCQHFRIMPEGNPS